MKKNLFFIKNNNNTFIFVLSIILSIVSLYFLSFYLNTNDNMFTIKNKTNIYYIIPDDKEGEKVKFINKKSINDLNLFNEETNSLINIDNLGFTIQIYSDSNYQKLNNYLNNIINLKYELVSLNEFFIFSIDSSIGRDYFLTFGNYNTKTEAMNDCNKFSFIKKCLVINPQN